MKKTIDFKQIADAALSVSRSLVPQWLPNGKTEGCEWVAPNPKRADKSAGSFKVNLSTGKWGDFIPGGPQGMDLISLYAFLNDLKNGASAKLIAEQLRIGDYRNTQPSNISSGEAEEWKHISPVPADAPPLPEVYKRKEGDTWVDYPIKYRWPYHDALGNVVGYVCRFEKPDGHKGTPPLTYRECIKGKRPGEKKWRYKWFDGQRLIFNLHRITNQPAADIIIVEGEKCASSFQAIIDESNLPFVVTTWSGGSKSVSKSDWKPLSGRRCVIWPDADGPGLQASLQIIDKLKSIASAIKLVKLPSDKPDGWDVFDAIADGWTVIDCLQFIKDNAVAQNLTSTKPEKTAPENSKDPTAAEIETVIDTNSYFDPDRAPWQFLGYNHGVHYYLPKGTGQILGLSTRDHTANSLFGLAPLSFWERSFPERSGPNWKLAASTLIRLSESRGVFNPSKVRGRGAWFDEKRSVVHLGDKLIVDGQETEIHGFKTKFIYETSAAIEYSHANPLQNEESKKLREIFEMLFWEKPIHSLLVSGWTAVAPICGALNYRPHLWITGSAGSGKSYVIDKIVKPCIGQFGLPLSSKITEPGIRQDLGGDALAAMIDEFESETEEDKRRVQNILDLARHAFVDSHARIVKGGQSGRSISYNTRSTFLMGSVGVALVQKADLRRVCVVTLTPPKDTETLTKDKHFEELNKLISATITEEWCNRLRARSIKLIPIIRQNTDTFATAVANKLKNRGSGDQVGALLAGAYSLQSENLISYESARTWVEMQDWSDQEAAAEDNDERRCLNTILQHLIRVSPSQERSVAELIEICKKGTAVLWDEKTDSVTLETADDVLSRCGIRYDHSEDVIYISDSHTSIRKMLEKTPWERTYPRLIKRVKNSINKDVVRFLKIRTRATGIPYNVVFNS